MGNEEKILDNKKLFDEIIDYRKLWYNRPSHRLSSDQVKKQNYQ
jgi:hypothetical protein